MLSQKHVQGLTESHQHLRKTEELARIVNNKKDLYEDKEAWSYHQELTTLYRYLLLDDLEFALDRKVEQDLWNVCFKNYISHLQTRIRDKRLNTVRGDAQLLLSWFLEFSSGFYTTFLTEIQHKFNLDIPFLKSGDPYSIWSDGNNKPRSSTTSETPGVNNCNYLCQYCLVHLGDVARYRNQMRQAETFYRHAISLAPGSGQPYNQIAILEASRGNKLSAVYFYVRAICLKYPFPAASTNLGKMLGKLSTADTDKPGRVTQPVFVSMFLKLHALLHHTEKLRSAVRISNMLSESLTSLIVSDSLTTWQLLQIININMWCYHQVTADQGGSKEERLVSGVVSSCQAALLSSCLLPVYTLQKGEQLLDYFALPAVRLLLEWIRCYPEVLTEKGFTTRPQIWPGLVRLLNEITPLITEFDSTKLKDYPLPEDYDMQAFTPLNPVLSKFNMKQVVKGGIEDTKTLSLLRCSRLVEIGHNLSRGQVKVISYSQENEAFESVDVEWKIVKDDPDVLVEEIEMLEDIDSSEDSDSPVPVWVENRDEVRDNTKSILKTKVTDTTPSPGSSSPSPMTAAPVSKPKPRLFQRNVALSSIIADSPEDSNHLSAAVSDSKKVMFKTPSPSNSQSSSSQLSASQDDIPVPLLPNPPPPPRISGRRPWSPVPLLPPPAPAPVVRSQMCVEELDFTVPPPSLHSNVRPPSLFSAGLAPPGLQPPGPLGLPPQPPPGPASLHPQQSRNLVSDIHALRPADLKEMLPPPGSYPAPAPNTLLPSFSGLSLAGERDWPTPSDSSPGHNSGKVSAVTPGHAGPNPLLSLISAVERPNTLPAPGSAGLFSQPYSLFSPSSWPGPLLSSPASSTPSSTLPPAPPPVQTNTSVNSSSSSSSSIFGSGVGGPSPLERLLHQVTIFNKR